MKKIIWLAFALLAALWTGMVAITLQLTDWLLGTIATTQVPGNLALPDGWSPPLWAEPLVASGLLESLQGTLVWMAQTVNQILPFAGGLGTLISVLGWIVWAVVFAIMLAVALGLHWFVGRREGRDGGALPPTALR